MSNTSRHSTMLVVGQTIPWWLAIDQWLTGGLCCQALTAKVYYAGPPTLNGYISLIWMNFQAYCILMESLGCLLLI